MAERSEPSHLTIVVLVGLAVFGAIVLVEWFLSNVLGFVKFVAVVVIVLAAGAAIISAKGRS